MPSISMRQLLEAGVHFGHQTRRWNPKMKPFIFAERNGIHIIDLAQTVSRLEAALAFVTDTVANGDYVLFVGTKKQAQEPVAEEAARAEMPYVNHRWLGGMLTNFVTIRKRVGLLDQMEARQTSGDLDRLSKKEASHIIDEMGRLQLKLGGVRRMRRLPGAVFVIDPQRERIAVTEARRLEIPVIATGDTNVDPDQIDYIIPANDDAIRAIRLLCRLVSDAAIEGLGQRAARAAEEPPMGADVSDAEEASDEVMAAIAAGGTYSFEPEPDEDDSVLPGEASLEGEDADEEEAAPAQAVGATRAERPRATRARAARNDEEPGDEADAEADEDAAPRARGTRAGTAAEPATEPTAEATAPTAEATAPPAAGTPAEPAAEPAEPPPAAAAEDDTAPTSGAAGGESDGQDASTEDASAGADDREG